MKISGCTVLNLPFILLFIFKYKIKVTVILLQTWFVGEMGRDTGGVTRELWRLLGLSLTSLCEGPSHMRVFRHDSERVGVKI